jgi:phospholipid transport system substrate-binding protein
MTPSFLRTLVGATVLGASVLCAAQPKIDAATMLHTAVDEVLAIAYDGKTSTATLVERSRPLLEQHFNFEVITRRAIGPAWKQFTPEQQARVVALFTELVIRTYANRFEPGERPGISYATAVTPDPARPAVLELPTTIDYAGKKYSIVYRVEQAGESWRVNDVNIEGVSMIANWRSQLAPISQRGGAAAVIAALEKNLAQTNIK